MRWLIISFLVYSLQIGSSETASSTNKQVDISQFFGSFVGQTSDVKPRETKTRKLAVDIKAYGEDGFKVDWRTVMSKIDGRVKIRSSSIAFKPTRRIGIYASAMKTDVFGNEVPLDPVSGDPFVWATLKDNILHIHRLFIPDSGGYEFQSYKRSLNSEGLTIQFTRYRDGNRQTFEPALMKRKESAQ